MATKLGTLTLDLVAKIGNFTQGMRQASSSAEREMQRASNSVNVMNGMLGKLAATAGAVFSINQIKNYADSYTGIVNQLKLVTSGQAELNTAMNDTYKIAQATASSWGAVNTVYSKYMSNAKVLNLTQAETARLTEVTSKAVSISGSTTEAAAGALFQFGQALDGNILRAEEYNSLVDGAGGLLNAMAKGLGVTRGELRQMMLDGKLSGQVITEALLKAGDSVDELYSKTDTTIAASFNLITTEVTKMVGEFDSATGASKTFVQGITLLSQNMEGVVNSMMVGAAFMAGTYIPAIYSTITAGYAKTKQLIDQTAIQYGAINAEKAAAVSALAQAEAQLVNTQSTLAALAAEKALEVQRLQAQINAAGRMATATRMAQLRQIEVQVTAELTAAETALAAARTRATAAAAAGIGVGRTALGILGGPVGIGITLAAVAAGYLLMKDGAEKATTSIDYQGQKLEDLIVKYRELNTLQRDNETKALADQVQDLSVKFRVASSDLSSFMQALPASDEKIDFFVKLTKEYQNGKISSDAYYKAVKEVNFLTDEQLDKVRGLTGRYDEAKGKFNAAEVAQDALANSMGSTTQKAKEQAAEVARLSEEIKKLLSTNKEAMLKNTSLNAMIGAGADPKLAEYLYEARKAQGILGTSKMLSEDVRKSVLARYNSEIGLNKTLEDRAKIEERNRKLVEAQGNAMKVNALVASNAAKANAEALEAAKNLPKGLLSAVNMVESPKSNSATSRAGAGGPMQFMPATADRYKVDIKSVESSYRGASNYLKDLLKMFDGDLENALRAYNWGEGNMQNYLKYGSGMKPLGNNKFQKGYFPNYPMPKETREYSGKVMGFMGGASGVSFTEGYSYDDWLKEQEQFAIEREKLEKEVVETKKAIQVSYYNEWQNLEYDNQERIKEIEKAFATDPTERDRLLGLQQKAYEDDVANWIKAQDDRVKAENEANQQIILARQNAFAMMNGPLGDMVQTGVEASARASMNPEEYQRWQMNNEQQDGYSQLGDDLYSARSGIESNEYLSETEKYRQLNDAYKVYLDGKKALTEEYAKQEAEYAQYQHDNQLSMYGSLLSRAGTVWGSMTEMVKDAAGEGSAAYKAMFLAQQAIAIGQAIINTELGATKALAEGGMIMGMPAATMVRAMGYASVGLIAAQTIQGMAHDGIDNIPKEGTWLLDKGERVVDSRTNADLKNYLANGGGSSGDVKISQSITFADGGAKVDTEGQKEIAQSLNNMMDAWARRESRQGGVLHKLARG